MSYKEKLETYSGIVGDFFREYSFYITAISVAVAIGVGAMAYNSKKSLEEGIKHFREAKSKLEACLVENTQK